MTDERLIDLCAGGESCTTQEAKEMAREIIFYESGILIQKKRANWSTAPNSVRMPKPWYSNSRKKWEVFSKQWKRCDDIDFVDLLIFFGNLFNEEDKQ